MALSFEELDTQSAEALPAREVMSSIGGMYSGPSSTEDISGMAGGLYGRDPMAFFGVEGGLDIGLDLGVLNVEGAVAGGGTVAIG